MKVKVETAELVSPKMKVKVETAEVVSPQMKIESRNS